MKSRNISVILSMMLVLSVLAGCAPAAPTAVQPTVAVEPTATEPATAAPTSEASAPAGESPAGAPPAGGQMGTTMTLTSDLAYTSANGESLYLDIYQDGGTTVQPVIIWIPRLGKDEYNPADSQFQGMYGVGDKFPTPIPGYVGYGYVVVSVQYSNAASKAQNLDEAIAFLKANATQYNLDASNIGVLSAAKTGYTAEIAEQSNQSAEAATPLTIEAGNDASFATLQSAASAESIIGFFQNGSGGGAYDAAVDPTSMPDPLVSWADPITNVGELASYHLYPTTHRGENTVGSYIIYLPKDYATSGKSYPVLYYLHGGQGSQRDAYWLMEIMDAAMQAGTMPQTIIVGVQGLPIGWFSNANTGAEGVTSGPVEDVVINDLIPHINATYRTVASPEGRGIEGWSAGGFGALRLAFKYPDLFGYTSSLAGAVINWEDEKNVQYLTNTFGPGDEDAIAYFNSVRPLAMAEQNAVAIAEKVTVRLLVGDQDWLYNNDGNYITQVFSEKITALGIEHEYAVIPGVGHMLPSAFSSGEATYPIEFWQQAFAQFK